MTWQRVTPGAGPASLLQLLDRVVPARFVLLDPLLVWADLTRFAGFSRTWDINQPIPLAYELRLADDGKPDTVDPALLAPTTGTAMVRPYGTGLVAPDKLADLANEPKVRRLRIGLAAIPMHASAPEGTGSVASLLPEQQLQGLVIGIIDHGIAFANRCFAKLSSSGWSSRVERVWDQEDGLGPTAVRDPRWWNKVNGFPYGRELTNLPSNTSDDNFKINQLMDRFQSDDAAIYRLVDYQPAQHAAAHGTHVASLAAGTRPSGDAASSAAIIAVQLPAKPLKDTSGASLCVHLLDAVCYLIRHAAGRKLVINFSDGAFAGPHDGSSLLESALDQLLGVSSPRDSVAMVVAAGNQFAAMCHWQATVPKLAGTGRGKAQIHWKVLPDDWTDSFLEIWLPANLPASALDALTVAVCPPGQPLGQEVGVDQVWAWKPQAEVVCSVAFLAAPPNALNRSCIQVSIAATALPAKGLRQLAPHGIWTVVLANSGANDIAFDAYVERDDPALGDKGPRRQSHFVHPDYPRGAVLRIPPADDAGNPSPIRRMGALNNVATAENITVVGGAAINADCTGKALPTMAPYSASGPGRKGAVNGVDLVAPSDTSATVRGVRGAATRSGVSFRMDGTSVAAPQVSREMANAMAMGNVPQQAKDKLKLDAARNSTKVQGQPARVGEGWTRPS